MPTKRANSDLSQMVVEIHERTDALEKKGAVDHERITVLERQATTMSALPGRVDALGQQVIALDKSMIREVDGLREQQKAHKNETAEKMAQGFADIGNKVDAVVKKVDQTALREATQRGWWQILQVIGSVLVSFAVLAEAVKTFIH